MSTPHPIPAAPHAGHHLKRIRVEVKFKILVHEGEDVTEDGKMPARDVDATTSTDLVRVQHLGHFSPARDAVSGILASIAANTMPVLGERLREQLRAKGL